MNTTVRREAGAIPEPILFCRNRLGESILWDDREGLLRWVNIHDRQVWSWDPASPAPAAVLDLPERPGAIGLRTGGGLVVGLEKGFALLDLRSGHLDRIAAVDADRPTVRLNDGRVAPGGRFVCGGMDENEPQRPIAALHVLEPDGSSREMLDGIHCTNSLCWSPDGGTMFLTDMPSRRIDAFDYDPDTGAASSRRPFARLDGVGFADGSAVDAEGGLWNAEWGGARLVRFRPDGTRDIEVPLPVTNPTCVAFGGPDLDTLFITSAWFGLDDAQRALQPQAGSLFRFKPGVRGCPERRYGG